MFLFRWLDAILQALGLKNKQARIIILGLDNAGKSTLVHKLCTNEVRLFVPTIKAHSKVFTLGRIEFTAWDLGGHEQVSMCGVCSVYLWARMTGVRPRRCAIYGKISIAMQTRLYSWSIARTRQDLARHGPS